MRIPLIIALSTIASITSLVASEVSPRGKAVDMSKSDLQFKTFAEEVIQATKSADADRLKKHTLIGDAASFWEATKMGLQMMTHMKVESASYDFDGSKKFYEKKGKQWTMSHPADGELAVTFKIQPQEGLTSDETTVRYMIAKTQNGWRIVLPTKKK